MNRTIVAKVAVSSTFALGLCACSGMSSMGSAGSLYDQLGGMDSVSKMANSVVSSSIKDPRLSSLLGSVNSATATPKVADQLCASLGGGCKAPYSDQQVAAAADRLTPEQKSAVSDNLSSSLGSITSNPMLRSAVTKALGPKMGGILGAL